MRLLQAGTALRLRAATRPRALVLLDDRGELRAGDLLGQVHLRTRRGAAPVRLADLPPQAPLREVLLTVLAGDGTLEPRSSGSTGTPRTQRRGPLSPAQLSTLLDLSRRIGMRPGRVVASLAPGVHGHGLLIALGALALRCPLVDLTHLPPRRRIELLQRTGPHVLTGLPVHLHDLLEAEEAWGANRVLRIPRVVSGSDVLSLALRADLSRRFRARVHDVYGTTETGSLAVDGWPLAGVRIRAADGLLRVRTPFTAGRELVTDRGTVDARGRVRVLGRADGSIASGGMIHQPAEVVRLLRAQRGVDTVRLRVVEDARLGARTVAEVTLDPSLSPEDAAALQADALSPAALRALVRDRLGAAAVPREVRFSSPGR